MKKIVAFVSILVLSLSSLSVLFVGQAFAAAKTWTGGGADNNMMTAGNWSGGAPSAGDALIFPYGSGASGVPRKSPVNNFPGGTGFDSITFSGSQGASESTDYVISGNSMVLTNGITESTAGAFPFISANVTLGANQTVSAASSGGVELGGAVAIGTHNIIFNDNGGSISLQGNLTGSGTITKNGAGSLSLDGDNSGYSGAITENAGSMYTDSATALGDTTGGTTVNNGSNLSILGCGTSLTVGENITLTGASSSTTGDYPTPKLYTETGCMGGGGNSTENYGIANNTNTVTLSGNIILGSDITFGSGSLTSFTGALSGGFALNLVPGYTAPVVINGSSNSTNTPNGTYNPPVFTKTLSDSQPSNTVLIDANNTIIITGTRSDISVEGGILKGTGTVGIVNLDSGTIAPGLSPGVLNTHDLAFTGGTYQAELGGVTPGLYDQLNVTGAVALGSATTLTPSVLSGFAPKVGTVFTIISNDGSDPVTGTFKGLAEGATVAANGYTFKVSYVGGDGNDVTLTVLSVPPVPNTGLSLAHNDVLPTLMLLCVVVPGLVLAARRTSRSSKR